MQGHVVTRDFHRTKLGQRTTRAPSKRETPTTSDCRVSGPTCDLCCQRLKSVNWLTLPPNCGSTPEYSLAVTSNQLTALAVVACIAGLGGGEGCRRVPYMRNSSSRVISHSCRAFIFLRFFFFFFSQLSISSIRLLSSFFFSFWY